MSETVAERIMRRDQTLVHTCHTAYAYEVRWDDRNLVVLIYSWDAQAWYVVHEYLRGSAPEWFTDLVAKLDAKGVTWDEMLTLRYCGVVGLISAKMRA